MTTKVVDTGGVAGGSLAAQRKTRELIKYLHGERPDRSPGGTWRVWSVTGYMDAAV